MTFLFKLLFVPKDSARPVDPPKDPTEDPRNRGRGGSLL